VVSGRKPVFARFLEGPKWGLGKRLEKTLRGRLEKGLLEAGKEDRKSG
jgi:hypothetical protein